MARPRTLREARLTGPLVSAFAAMLREQCFLNTPASIEVAHKLALIVEPTVGPVPETEYIPMNKVAQKLHAESGKELTNSFIFSRPFGLLIRNAAKEFVEARYCANADDLLVNWLYERLKSQKVRLNSFALYHAETTPEGVELWKWRPVTVMELRQMIEKVLPDGEPAAG